MASNKLIAIFVSGIAAVCWVVGCRRDGAEQPVADPAQVTALRAQVPPPPPDLGSGWGRSVVRLSIGGEIPVAAAIAMGRKDPLCKCQIYDEAFVIDPATRGLSNVLIYAVDAPRVTDDYLMGPPKEVIFAMKDCRFVPHVIASSMRDEFVVLNLDVTGHNSSGSPGRGNAAYSTLLASKTGRYEYPGFKNALSAPCEFTCSIHPWMKAYHIVRPDPYFAVTGVDGSFAIERLPAGVTLTFQVWHERAAGDNHGLRARPTWSERGRFEIKIPADGDVVTLDVDVDSTAFE